MSLSGKKLQDTLRNKDSRSFFFLLTACLRLSLLLPALLLANGSLALGTEAERQMVDGTVFLQSLNEEAQKWADYACQTEMHNFKQEKATVSHSHYFYRKGPEIRIEVVGGGFRDGSIVLKRKDGSITARGGIWMGGIQMKLDPDSRMLILPSGINATRANFPEVYQSMKEELSRGASCKVCQTPVLEPSLHKQVFVLETYGPKQEITRRVYLSANEKRPLRWDNFTGGKLIMSTMFKNIQVNCGLKDEKFKI